METRQRLILSVPTCYCRITLNYLAVSGEEAGVSCGASWLADAPCSVTEWFVSGVLRSSGDASSLISLFAETSRTEIYPSNLEMLGSARLTWFVDAAAI